MITLSKHIEILLLEHDCVIVPGLGGFIANQVSSRYGENNDELFLPPYRTLGFNQELTLNDGLLAQSYMQAYDTSYPEAYMQMEKDVNEMRRQLELNGTYTLNGIGTLTKGIEDGITFTAPESGILTPSLYGLYSVEVIKLDKVKKDREIRRTLSQTSIVPIQKADGKDLADSTEDNKNSEKESQVKETNAREEITVKIHKRWLEIGAAAAVAASLFFLITFPSLKSDSKLSDTCVASAVYVGKPSDLPKQPDGSAKPAEVEINNKEIKSHEQADNPSQIKSERIEKKATDKKFVIVLASCVSEKNANMFIEELNRQGLSEATFTKADKNRVTYSGYDTYREAANAIAELRKVNQAFENAWILKMK